MPKKFTGENSKAAAARDRKETTKQNEKDKKAKAVEDAYWAEDDKNVLKKQARKQDEEKKKLEAQKRKEENRKAAEEEMSNLHGKSTTAASKVTRADIQAKKDAEQKQREMEAHKEKLVASKIVPQSDEIESNVNLANADTESARNIEEAIAVLGDGEGEVDKHPEKRMKAAYDAYYDANLQRLKDENPSLRLSQLKQLIWKEWGKAPENPINAKFAALSMKQ